MHSFFSKAHETALTYQTFTNNMRYDNPSTAILLAFRFARRLGDEAQDWPKDVMENNVCVPVVGVPIIRQVCLNGLNLMRSRSSTLVQGKSEKLAAISMHALRGLVMTNRLHLHHSTRLSSCLVTQSRVSTYDDFAILITKLRQLGTYVLFEALRKVQLFGCFPHPLHAINCRLVCKYLVLR